MCKNEKTFRWILNEHYIGDLSFLGHGAVLSRKSKQTFQRFLLPP
jgi:hypothetical protein